MKKTLLSLVTILAFASFVNAQVPARTGWWKFDDITDLWKSEVGPALVSNGNITSVEGPVSGNLAVEVPLESYLSLTHGIAPNGGGAKVNEYSIMWDFKIPATETWYSFLETDKVGSDDSDLFIAKTANSGINRVPNSIGTGSLLYTMNTVAAETWYRMIISVKNGEFFNIYVNGDLWSIGTDHPGMLMQAIDERYGLAPTIFFFQDGDGDDGTLQCSEISMWDVALTDADALLLGDATTVLTGVKDSKGSKNSSDLMQNYPNPVVHSTIFPYQVVTAGNVSFRVMDQTGKVIDVINPGTKTPGRYELKIDAAKYPNGIYSVQMNANNSSSVRKMMIVK